MKHFLMKLRASGLGRNRKCGMFTGKALAVRKGGDLERE